MPTKKKIIKAVPKKVVKKVVGKKVSKVVKSVKKTPVKKLVSKKVSSKKISNPVKAIKKVQPIKVVFNNDLTKRAVSPKEGSIKVHIQRMFWWSGVSLVILATLTLLSRYSTVLNRDQLLPQKLAEVSVLSAQNEIEYEAKAELAVVEKPVSLLVVGDVMLARYVERKMRGNQDYNWPYYDSAEFLRDADITFGNLESPLLAGRNVDDNSYTFRADPSAAKGLEWAGFDVISVANNHVMNYREYGLATTLKALRENNVQPVGGGLSVDEAHTPVVKVVNNQRVAFYAYVDDKIPPGYNGATFDGTPGIAAMDIESVKNDVKNALKIADFVVVSMHAGREYQKEPTEFQKDFAHAAIDAGASVVVGTHPHVVQPVERYGNGVIFYSLGNFVFDQFFNEEVKTGLVAKIFLQKGVAPIFELYPSRSESVQPKIITEEPSRSQILYQVGIGR